MSIALFHVKLVLRQRKTVVFTLGLDSDEATLCHNLRVSLLRDHCDSL